MVSICTLQRKCAQPIGYAIRVQTHEPADTFTNDNDVVSMVSMGVATTEAVDEAELSQDIMTAAEAAVAAEAKEAAAAIPTAAPPVGPYTAAEAKSGESYWAAAPALDPTLCAAELGPVQRVDFFAAADFPRTSSAARFARRAARPGPTVFPWPAGTAPAWPP